MSDEITRRVVCSNPECGSDNLYIFNAGGLLQARCRRCTKVQVIGPHNYVREEEITEMSSAGPRTVAVPTPTIAPGEHIFEHDLDTGGFRDPRKQYRGEDYE